MSPWCGHVPTKEWLIDDSPKKEWWLKKKENLLNIDGSNKKKS
jgi:hypothetical protein